VSVTPVSAIGEVALWASCGLGIVTAWKRTRSWAVATLAAALTASGVLFWAFATDQFRFEAVDSYSRSAAAMPYKLAGFWGGMAGSLLLWVTLAAALGLGVIAARDRAVRAGSPSTSQPAPIGLAVYPAIVAVYGSAAALFANPFELYSDGIPAGFGQGSGMAPILEHPAMVSHPPLVYLGLLCAMAPLALSLSGLQRTSRTAARVAWGVLLTAMTIGGWWAYAEVGWGGFWAWDPVENASLLPWLALTGLLHARLDGTARKEADFWAYGAAALAVAGSVLARSGSISSVHAFAESGAVSLWVLTWVTAGVVVALLARKLRPRSVPAPSATEDSARGVTPTSMRTLEIALLVAIAIVGLGTARPLLSAETSDRIAVAPRFFATFTAPIALVLVVLMGGFQSPAATGAAWRSTLRYRPWTAYAATSGWAALMAACALIAGAWGDPVGAVGVFAAVFASSMAILTGWGHVRPSALVAHLGFILLMFGVAGSVSGVTEAQTIETGRSAQLAGYEVMLEEVGAVEATEAGIDDPDIVAQIFARVRLDGHGQRFVATPRLVGFERQATVLPETVLRPGLADTQVALRLADDDGRALIEVSRKPLVTFVWIGALIMLAALVSALLGPRRQSDQAAGT
jgi:cytochrome c-type biogenesis protein CcmF